MMQNFSRSNVMSNCHKVLSDISLKDNRAKYKKYNYSRYKFKCKKNANIYLSWFK